MIDYHLSDENDQISTCKSLLGSWDIAAVITKLMINNKKSFWGVSVEVWRIVWRIARSNMFTFKQVSVQTAVDDDVSN